jgi:hypothetical protein
MLQNTAVLWSPRTQHFHFHIHFQTPLRMLSLRGDTTTRALQLLVFADRKRKWKPTQLPTNQPPRNRSRAPRPRGPGIPDRKKGPKKPTAEPTSMPLGAASPNRPTLIFAAIALHGSDKTPSHPSTLHNLPSPLTRYTSLPSTYSPGSYMYGTYSSMSQHSPPQAASSRVAAAAEAPAKSPPTSLVPASMAPSPLLEHHRLGTHSLVQPTHVRVILSSVWYACCCLLLLPLIPARQCGEITRTIEDSRYRERGTSWEWTGSTAGLCVADW